MDVCQRDLFDQAFDTPLSLASSGQAERKSRTRKPIQPIQHKETVQGGLLPWMFPEDFPELQAQIQAEEFFWSDYDIRLLCEGLLFQSAESLCSLKSGPQVRNEVLGWIVSPSSKTAFSFTHVCIEAQLNVERVKAGIAHKLMNVKRRLRVEQSTGVITQSGRDYLCWLYQVNAVIESMMAIEDGCTHTNRVEYEAHYLREHGKVSDSFSV